MIGILHFHIDLTLENLTVSPQDLHFDDDGHERTQNALIGAPLTVAASTVLKNVRPESVNGATPDNPNGTNGVVSSANSGDNNSSNSDKNSSVVQWATVLAPPQSGSSATLQLDANVKDFAVPTFSIAVQPGLSQDLSLGSVIANAFNNQNNSEMALQQRTVSLVADVNGTLAKAGATIADVRSNLEDTSQTLGVQTASQLRDNSKALAQTMSGMKDQLGALRQSLSDVSKTTHSDNLSRLQETVSTMDSMLGDTSAVPQIAQIQGDACTAQVAKPGASSTVYSSLLTMASQLNAYAQINVGCRDAVAQSILNTVGPPQPTTEQCQQTPSMTCALYASTATMNTVLDKMAAQGNDLVKSLQPQVVQDAINEQDASVQKIATAQTAVHHLQDQIAKDRADGSAVAQSRQQVQDAVNDAKESLETTHARVKDARNAVQALHTKLEFIRQNAIEGKHQIDGSENQGQEGGNQRGRQGEEMSMDDQVHQLTQEICNDTDMGGSFFSQGLSRSESARLRSYLSDEPCQNGADSSNGVRPDGVKQPLDTRLNQQADLWKAVLDATDTSTPDANTSAAFDNLDASVDTQSSKLDAVVDAVNNLDKTYGTDDQGIIDALSKISQQMDEATDIAKQAGVSLRTVQDQQNQLGDKIENGLSGISDNAKQDLLKSTQQQARVVTTIGLAGAVSVVDAFNNSVAGLQDTSGSVTNNAKKTVDQQHADLAERAKKLSGSLDANTKSSLEQIDGTTGGATRDVDGARTLLSSSLDGVMADLGNQKVEGSGLLGAMSTSAAKAGTADYQVALAAQNAEGYSNLRSQDITGILARQAQFKASIQAADNLPAFDMEVPAGADTLTLYTFTVAAAK